jgi:sugar transferase (PEP-CTERM/EpsH1 system associated)
VKILCVTHRFPFPPNRGGKIRPFHIIRHLSRNHEVVVASLGRSKAEVAEAGGIKDYCSRFLVEHVTPVSAAARMLGRLPTPAPSSMGYFYSPALARRIRQETREARFDLILVHCSSVAQYVENVSGVRKMLDFGDMDSQKWLEYSRARRFPLSIGYAIEGWKMRRAEARLARKFDLCTCTTRAELRILQALGTGTELDWFPNGVNTEYFAPGSEPKDPELLSFVGRMDYYPNQDAVFRFCGETLPVIRKARPQVKLTIIGANPSRRVRRLESIPGVTVTGSVPDVRPHVRRSSVAVVPLKIARGTQNKVLETLAMGIPTVVSEAAAGGVDAIPGEHFLTASTSQEFAAAVLKLLEDPLLQLKLSEAGRRRMMSHHSWDASMSKLDSIVERCLRLSPSRRYA